MTGRELLIQWGSWMAEQAMVGLPKSATTEDTGAPSTDGSKLTSPERNASDSQHIDHKYKYARKTNAALQQIPLCERRVCTDIFALGHSQDWVADKLDSSRRKVETMLTRAEARIEVLIDTTARK